MIYFDSAATTPIDEKVRKAMCPYFAEHFGNPSSIYSIGREAKASLEGAREKVADMLGAKPNEIIFTSGATESNNLALKGVAFYWSQRLGIKPHIVISSIEHHSILDTAEYLKNNFGFEVSKVRVNSDGIVDPKDVLSEIKQNTAIVSVMYGNNEVGSIQPIKDIGKIIIDKNKDRENKIIFHSDAVQAFQYLETDVIGLGVDMLSLTAHKFYGPKGVGLIYIKKGVKYLPQANGGSQERGRRAGTENLPYIIGMVEGMEMSKKEQVKSKKEISELRNYLVKRIMEIPDVVLTGPGVDSGERLPHIASFIFEKIEGESILINLDLVGFAASSGSACTSGSLASSHVLTAMGYGDFRAHGSIRFSLGKMNKRDDVDELMKYLPGIVEKLRKLSPIK